MSARNLLLVLIILILVGLVPVWPYSRGWGYGPSGGLGLILGIFIVMVILGKW
ncbi:MAG: DUF3309 domain-containing protein [Proteobacteria bacterium]|nr:DUF3309 domain-containing protein [Pseudomonadota bacterium]